MPIFFFNSRRDCDAVEVEPPAAVADVDPESGVEFQDRQDRHVAVKIEQEGLRLDLETFRIRRVDFERTTGASRELPQSR